MHAHDRKPELTDGRRHETVGVLPCGSAEQKRVEHGHAIDSVTRVQKRHELSELLVFLHADADIAHRADDRVVARKRTVVENLDGLGHLDPRFVHCTRKSRQRALPFFARTAGERVFKCARNGCERVVLALGRRWLRTLHGSGERPAHRGHSLVEGRRVIAFNDHSGRGRRRRSRVSSRLIRPGGRSG